MSLYRISRVWSNDLDDRRRFILARLKARIRAEAEKEDERLSRNSYNVDGE